MSSGGIIRLSNPALDAQLAALTSQQGTLTGNQNTLQTNLAALVTQVGALAPDNVIQNGEFTAQAVLDLLKTVDGTDSMLDADLLDGHQWQEVIDLINAADPMTAIADAAAAAVGTYAFLRRSIGGMSPGSSYSGNLYYSGTWNATAGSAVPGTWICLGHTPNNTSQTLCKRRY